MTSFLIGAFVLCFALAVATYALWALLASPSRSRDADVYRDQLASLEKDKARAVITASEYEAMRAEIARRLLATGASSEPTQAVIPSIVIGVVAVSVAILAAVAIYPWRGVPDYPDQPLDQRLQLAEENRASLPTQASLNQPAMDVDLSNEDKALVQQLREAVANRPNDLQGHVLLARNEARSGDFGAAAAAQKRVLDLRGTEATAADWGLYSEYLIIAAGNVISAEADLALREVLKLAPATPLAQFRLGQLHLQTGRPDTTLRIWNRLLEAGPESAVYMSAIRARIQDVAVAAGLPNYEAPSPRGPTMADIDAAAGLSGDDRTAMIQSMVDGLSERLATQGGSAADWAQLIRAYRVLGQTQQASLIYEEARTVFAGQPSDLRLLDDAHAAQESGQ